MPARWPVRLEVAPVAERVVERNGAVLVSFVERPGRSPQSLLVVDIVVQVDGVAAEASGERFVDTMGFP